MSRDLVMSLPWVPGLLVSQVTKNFHSLGICSIMTTLVSDGTDSYNHGFPAVTLAATEKQDHLLLSMMVLEKATTHSNHMPKPPGKHLRVLTKLPVHLGSHSQGHPTHEPSGIIFPGSRLAEGAHLCQSTRIHCSFATSLPGLEKEVDN